MQRMKSFCAAHAHASSRERPALRRLRCCRSDWNKGALNTAAMGKKALEATEFEDDGTSVADKVIAHLTSRSDAANIADFALGATLGARGAAPPASGTQAAATGWLSSCRARDCLSRAPQVAAHSAACVSPSRLPSRSRTRSIIPATLQSRSRRSRRSSGSSRATTSSRSATCCSRRSATPSSSRPSPPTRTSATSTWSSSMYPEARCSRDAAPTSPSSPTRRASSTRRSW